LDGKRDITVYLKDGTQFEIEVKSGIKHHGRNLQRIFMRTFRNAVPEDERSTREGRNKVMWSQGIMLINATIPDENITESIKKQRAEIVKYAPVDIFVEKRDKVNIGQLAFSGRANPDDAVKWAEQNPQ
jgi:hypothetical protein